jgi:hypothetical protein
VTITEDACAVLQEVIDRWPDFVESRIKGTARPHVATPPKHRDELAEGEGYGCIPAPLHLDILDSMSSIVAWSDMLHELVAQTVGHPRLAPAASALADPRPFLRYVVELLPEAAESDDEISEAALDKARRMQSIIISGLGEIFDGQTLDAVCPFCLGQTFKRPGLHTLRVRLVPSRVAEGEMEFVIVCENPDGCRPFAAECDMWVKDRPAWPWSQWEWLASRLIPAHSA